MEGPTTKEHKKHENIFVGAAVITLSDTRTLAEDDSGHLIRRMLEEEGHNVPLHVVIKDDKELLRKQIEVALHDDSIRLIITNGGTGVGPRDITIETVKPFLDKEISAFGVLFTELSYADIGTSALLSRASAGIAQGKAIFSVPGSPKAVELAMKRLILPELQHVLHHIKEVKR
ncbi:MAG: MogA/MoaB family molybdenum cofactor biosynthesis protein [Nanoarchaeota archaeon]